MPRKLKTRPASRIDVCNTYSQLQPIAYKYQNADHFRADRFQVFAPTHHSAVITGSTIQDGYSNQKIKVSDASLLKYIEGNHSERVGVYVELTTATLTNKMTSLMGVSIKNDNSTLKNLGDGIIFVVDSETRQVKQILNPRLYNKTERGQNAPANVVDLLSQPNILQYVDQKDVQLNPNDIVILATAGFVESLAFNEKEFTLTSLTSLRRVDDAKDVRNPSSQMPCIQKQIDIDKLNERLALAFRSIQSNYQTSVEPPAFAIAEQLIKDVTNNLFNDRSHKIAFAQQMQQWVEQYYTSECRLLLDQLNSQERQIREQCAQQYTTDKFLEFRSYIETFQNHFANIYFDRHEVKADFVKLVAIKMMVAISRTNTLAPDEKGKGRAIEGDNKELSHEALCEIFINALADILREKDQANIKEMMALVAVIFKDAIDDLARKLSMIAITLENMKTYLNIFVSKIVTYEHFKVLALLQQIKINNIIWQEYLAAWVNQPGSVNLSTQVVAFFKNAHYKDNDKNLINEIAPLLEYINYINQKRETPAQIKSKIARTSIAQFKTWFNRQCPDNVLKEQFHHYLDQNDVGDEQFLFVSPALVYYHKGMKKEEKNTEHTSVFSLCHMKCGDDTSIAVAYVPDPAVEIIRAMIDFPDQRKELWNKLSVLLPTNENLENIYLKLRNEKHISENSQNKSTMPNRSVGQTLEELPVHVTQSYSEDEILDVKQFLLPKVKLLQEVARINNIPLMAITKSTVHTQLKDTILNDKLSILERCALYNQLSPEHFAKLNEHRHSSIDNLFGINITRSWSQTLKEIRDNCLTKLMREVDVLLNNNGAAPTNDECIKALALLNNAIVQPLFNTHRNNSIFTGAYGDTEAAKIIRQRITIITDQLTALQNTQVDGVELKPLQPMKQ
jgi:hypothetical protein